MITHCDMDVQEFYLSPVCPGLNWCTGCLIVYRCLRVSLCLVLCIHSMVYTSFEKDTAIPKEKGSLMFPDPILEIWVGTCQSEITSCNWQVPPEERICNVRLAKDVHACPWGKSCVTNMPIFLVHWSSLLVWSITTVVTKLINNII